MDVKIAFVTLFMMLSTVCNAVESIDFSYSDSSDIEWFGYKKSEIYDVAIKIRNPSLVGSRVKSIGVSVPSGLIAEGTASGWISTGLILEKNEEGKKVNMPDIASVTATLHGDSLVAVFTDPVIMPEEGLYVGYSFTAIESSSDISLPLVAVGPVAETCVEDGWWMNASKSLIKWNNMGLQKGLACKLNVTFSGDFYGNAASLELPEKLWNVSNSDNTVCATMSNNGKNPIESVDYIYTVDGVEHIGHYVFSEPVMSCFGYPVEFFPEISGMDLLGWHSMVMSISRVNGEENRDLGRESRSDIDFIPFMPVSRPLVEEYTGLWCGWCPSGYVILEQMYDSYPENFVGVSYHTRDAMTVREEDELPSLFKTLPAMFINRGEEYNPLKVKRPWEKSIVPAPPAEMELSISSPADSIVEALCTTRFVNNHVDSNFKIGYILVADNLHNPAWQQANYYSGNSFDDLTGPYSDIFNFGSDYITDLRYDHVGIAFSEQDGENSLLPAEISIDNAYETRCSFDVSSVRNVSGGYFFNPDTRFRVVAILYDEDGEICTSVQSDAIDLGNAVIKDIPSQGSEIVSQEVYDLTGLKCAHFNKGVYIISTEYSDGTIKTEKIVR